MKKLIFLIIALPLLIRAQSFEDLNPIPNLPCIGTSLQNFQFSSVLPAQLYIYNLDTGTLASGIALQKGWQIQSDSATPPNYFLSAPSWYTDSTQANNLLSFQTPALPNQTCLSFQAWSIDPQYPELIEVWISTLGPNPDSILAGNMLLQETVPGQKNYYSIDLNAWAGQAVWVGLRHHSINKFIIALDNIQLTNAGANTISFESAGLNRKPSLADSLQIKTWLANRSTIPFSSGTFRWIRSYNNIAEDSADYTYSEPALNLNESVLITFPEKWVPTQTGIYSFKIVLNPGTTNSIEYSFSESVDFAVSNSIGIEENPTRIGPVPANDFLKIQCAQEWNIFNVRGALIHSGSGSSEPIILSTANWLPGIYFFRSSNKQVPAIKLIIQKL